MRRPHLLVTCNLMIVLLLGSPPGMGDQQAPHALWVWSRPEPGLARFARAHNFSRLLVNVPTDDAGGLPVWAAIPFWFDHDTYRLDGRSLLEQVIERVDGIVVMAYRDHAVGSDGILRHTVGELVAGAAAKRPVMIGVQTAADELDKLTFCEEGAAAMERELDALREALSGIPGFGGTAVHHFDSYRRLRP